MSLTSLAKLACGLSDLESRHLQVSADVNVGIPLQIRVMREAKGWNQTTLAEKIGTTQNAISRLESGSYGRPNVKTLLRLAEAFDVALLVKFVPFGRFARALDEMSATSVAIPSFADDEELKSMCSLEIEEDYLASRRKPYEVDFKGSSKVVSIDTYVYLPQEAKTEDEAEMHYGISGRMPPGMAQIGARNTAHA